MCNCILKSSNSIVLDVAVEKMTNDGSVFHFAVEQFFVNAAVKRPCVNSKHFLQSNQQLQRKLATSTVRAAN